MPIYHFEKLVRDRLPEIYAGLHQKATTKALSPAQHWAELKRKFAEEVHELPENASDKDAVTNELSDLLRLVKDAATVAGIDFTEVETTDETKTAKKGGFLQGAYVETLELTDDDPWNDYYRKEPQRFPEISAHTLPIFVTGNSHKAAFLAEHLGVKLPHRKLELDELQSLDLHEIAEHKARQAYEKLGQPVLIEDVSLELAALGGLPGTFIKWFIERMPLADICTMIGEDRGATAKVSYCLFDGKTPTFFDGEMQGVIATEPSGKRGFGFDPIFIPKGTTKTWGEMSDDEVQKFGLRTTTVFPTLRKFFSTTINH